jgi:hypothetical protein
LNEHNAPDGKPPVQERAMDCEVPLTKDAIIVFEPENPGLTLMLPLLDREKSKGCTISVN